MSPFTRNAKTVVRLVAAGFLVVGVLNLLMYWYQNHHDHKDLSILRCLWLSIPLVIGLLLLIKSSALARRLTQYFDE